MVGHTRASDLSPQMIDVTGTEHGMGTLKLGDHLQFLLQIRENYCKLD